MTESLRRVSAIAYADTLFRFRRMTAIITLLIIAGVVYLIVPDIQSGRTLMQVEGRRVIYNSASVALGTGMLCGLLIGLFGYYLVSNSLKRDILSRMGYIVASTPVSNSQYLFGKFLGNVAYLTIIMLVCMASAMVMFLLRGERVLEPFVFLEIYTWTTIPGIIFCSAIAIAFESLPALSGRFGDVLFFFVWGSFLGVPAALLEQNINSVWLYGLDVFGMAQTIQQLQEQFHTNSMSIGASEFDLAKPPIFFPGLHLSMSNFGLRFITFSFPALFFVLSLSWFHRFNPSRIKSSVGHAKRSIIKRFSSTMKPVTLLLQPLATIGLNGKNRHSLMNAVRADVMTTFFLSPITSLAVIMFTCISLFIDGATLQQGLLPAMVVVLIIALGDITTRDNSAGMMSLLFTTPKIKNNYVLWKFASALSVAFFFTLVPVIRLLFYAPSSAMSLLIGSFLLTSGAVGLGILTGSRKAFMGLYLMLLYIALNAPEEPSLDFAGFSGRATSMVQLVYAAIGAVLILTALVKYRYGIRRL